MIKFIFKHYILIFFIGLVYFMANSSCAKVGNPVGGPKDTIPPKILASIPENYSTSFNEKKIEVVFNEYLQLKNLNEELVVSPPLKKDPNVLIRYKSINVTIEDTLKEDVTYTIDFGNAIVDNNEGNPIKNYQYVFSTGDEIDSLRVTGYVLNAFDLKPPENRIYVALYENLADSAPYTVLPSYIAKTQKEDGSYSIKNVKEGRYKIFAFNDANSNLLFDLPNEQIAFADTPVFLNALKIVQDATFEIDTSLLLSDSIPETDSIAHIDSLTQIKKVYGLHTDLKLFEQEFYNQYLIKDSRENRYLLQLIFNEPYTDSLIIKLLDDPMRNDNWYFRENHIIGDTVDIWIADSTIYNNDTIWAITGYAFTDSLNNNAFKYDTLKFALKSKRNTRNKKDKEEETEEYLELKFNVNNNGMLDLNNIISLLSATPVKQWNTSHMKLDMKQDTLYIPKTFDINQSANNKRIFNIVHAWEPQEKYRLTLMPGAFTDYYNIENDTIELSFKIQKKEFYGTLNANLTGITSPIIVQLLDEKENKIREKYIANDTTLRFEYLPPKKYLLKIILDDNNNKKWDTGNYDARIQPEKVKYYDGNITIKSNWELDINWNINK